MKSPVILQIYHITRSVPGLAFYVRDGVNLFTFSVLKIVFKQVIKMGKVKWDDPEDNATGIQNCVIVLIKWSKGKKERLQVGKSTLEMAPLIDTIIKKLPTKTLPTV